MQPILSAIYLVGRLIDNAFQFRREANATEEAP